MALASKKPNYRLKHALSGHDKGPVSVKFSPGGALLASTSADCTVRIWDPHAGKLVRTLKGHEKVFLLFIKPASHFHYVISVLTNNLYL